VIEVSGQRSEICKSTALTAVLFALSFVGTLLFPLGFSAIAQQQAAKVWHIGYLAGAKNDTLEEPFRQGLRDLGYIEGKNILIEYRYYEGKLDRVSGVVAELVQLKVDVLVSSNLPTIRAAKQATKTIPIVMVTLSDPVAAGLVESLACPGGNITGLTRLGRELSGKRLELLKDAVPGISRVGVLWNAEEQSAAIGFKEYEVAAHAMKIQLQSLEIRSMTPDFEERFKMRSRDAQPRSSRLGMPCSIVTQSGLRTLP
jgi:putative tryptophan/tyrosine transport system substrate-binding protein